MYTMKIWADMATKSSGSQNQRQNYKTIELLHYAKWQHAKCFYLTLRLRSSTASAPILSTSIPASRSRLVLSPVTGMGGIAV